MGASEPRHWADKARVVAEDGVVWSELCDGRVQWNTGENIMRTAKTIKRLLELMMSLPGLGWLQNTLLFIVL